MVGDVSFFFAISPLVSLWFLTSTTKKCGCKKMPWNKHESILSVLMSKKKLSNYHLRCFVYSQSSLSDSNLKTTDQKSRFSPDVKKLPNYHLRGLIYSQSSLLDGNMKTTKPKITFRSWGQKNFWRPSVRIRTKRLLSNYARKHNTSLHSFLATSDLFDKRKGSNKLNENSKPAS